MTTEPLPNITEIYKPKERHAVPDDVAPHDLHASEIAKFEADG